MLPKMSSIDMAAYAPTIRAIGITLQTSADTSTSARHLAKGGRAFPVSNNSSQTIWIPFYLPSPYP